MKIKFFSIFAILIIVIAAFCVYLLVNHNTAINDIPAQNMKNQTTATPMPTITPIPVDYESSAGLYPAYQMVDEKKEYGYINDKGQFTIKPSFDIANDFHNNVAAVYMDNKYYLIDTTGSILYYSDNPIGDSHNSAAVISRFTGQDALYGYIDTDGREIIQPTYKMVSNFRTDNTAYVYEGNGKYALIDKNNKILKSYNLKTKYKPKSIEDGYIIYRDSSKNFYGVMNLEGKVIFKPKYCEIRYVGNDLFALKKPDDSYYNIAREIPSALYNAKGEQLTDFTLFDVGKFYNGYASVTDSTYTYFIGKDGKKVDTLPKIEGRGTMTQYGDVSKAEIDYDLIYCKKDSTVIWQNDTTVKLSDNISVKSIKFKPNKYALIYYPQVKGLTDFNVQDQINAKLAKLFTKSRVDLKESDKYTVDDNFHAKLIKHLLIIERDGYDYELGAAHGSPIKDFYYIDIDTGAFYQLKDLFMEGSDYSTSINDKITTEITASSKEESMYFPDAFTGIKENQSFMLNDSSLTIYFYPYEIAAYAAGFPQFELSFEYLTNYINYDGAFWRAFHD